MNLSTLDGFSAHFVDATPYAASLIEGHRDFGYNLQTALADIIDNSISAGATQIHLTVNAFSEFPWIALSDNGSGMTESELIEAMRLGTKNPTVRRSDKDLGRFGLGLKSASFSQCRSLTVITRQNGITSCARWDLDLVAKNNAWILEIIDTPEKVDGYDLLPESGTVVIWQKLDRLYGNADYSAKVREHINAEFSKAEYHLRLVFHRFLEGKSSKFDLYLNKRKLSPIDPTASSHPATQKDPEDNIALPNGNVRIRSYTLPHYKKMAQQEWDELGGPEGHLKSQGLYIYREDRLIIAGSWLGLTKQTELTKLSRIVLDIPNSMDSEWKIDVKKSSAQLPPLVRDRLLRVIERYVGTSKRTYRSRGQKLVDSSLYPMWNRVHKDGTIIFKPNIEHPVFQAYMKQLPDELLDGFERCMRLVGATLPIDALHAELVGNAESVSPDITPESDLRHMVNDLATTLLSNGVSQHSLKDVLSHTPFLRSNWNLSELLINEYLEKK